MHIMEISYNINIYIYTCHVYIYIFIHVDINRNSGREWRLVFFLSGALDDVLG